MLIPQVPRFDTQPSPTRAMKKSILSAAAAAFLLSAPNLLAASDYLLEIEGIKGESRDDVYPESIELESFSWGVTNTPSLSGGGGAGKVSFQDLHFTTNLSKASPQLMLACATGKHIPKAVLHVRKAGGDPVEYYTVTFTDILISSVQTRAPGATGGATGAPNPVPTESLSLNFTKIEFKYTEADGTVTQSEVTLSPGAP